MNIFNLFTIYLIKFDLLGCAALFVGVMAEGDVIVVVGESHHSLALLLGHREQVLEYVGCPLPEASSE